MVNNQYRFTLLLIVCDHAISLSKAYYKPRMVRRSLHGLTIEFTKIIFLLLAKIMYLNAYYIKLSMFSVYEILGYEINNSNMANK